MLFPSLACPEGLEFLEGHDGGLEALIMITRRAQKENDYAVLCDATGSPCCPISWSKKLQNIMLGNDCKEGAHIAWKGWVTCGTGKKG